jgi:acyl-CoA thioesterase-2
MSPPVSKPLANLLSILDLEQRGEDRFAGVSPDIGWRRIFGGQVVAQSLVAAQRTAPPGRLVHSLHGYFLKIGDPKVTVEYEVQRLRDGGSFSTRYVIGRQAGEIIFILTAGFHVEEQGLSHQIRMPKVTRPADCISEEELGEKLARQWPGAFQGYHDKRWPIEMRLTDPESFFDRSGRDPVMNIWMRARGPVDGPPSLHQAVLAYASDFSIIDTAVIAHGKILADPSLQIASLDHAVWFHRPFRTDEWLLYAQESPTASGSRGMCRGLLFKEDGTLVASVAQEGLMRVRDPERMKRKA